VSPSEGLPLTLPLLDPARLYMTVLQSYAGVDSFLKICIFDARASCRDAVHDGSWWKVAARVAVSTFCQHRHLDWGMMMVSNKVLSDGSAFMLIAPMACSSVTGYPDT